MAIKKLVHRIFNIFTKYSNNGDVINGDVYYINPEQIYKILTQKENYSEFYKRYISKFDELQGYAFSLFYPSFNQKKFDFTSNTLVFGKKIIDWVYGLSEFPNKEIQKFYNDLQKDFDLNDDTVIVKRWKANIAYFNSDIKQASHNYSELYDELFEYKDIPEWYLDDICIDGRNLLHQYENMISRYSFDNKFQSRITSNKHKLSYPDIDRIKAEIFENVSKNIFNNKNKSKFTTIYGIGLEECFVQIQNLVFLTIFYGSITHLKLVRELVSNIMYMYADTFENEEFYNLTLRMLFLSGEFKKYRNLYNKIKLKFPFVISDNFMKSIIDSRKSLFKFEEDKNNVFLFDIYGRYLDNDLYISLEENILDIITIKDDYNINIISNAFKAIATNIKRSKKIGNLLTIMNEYFIKSYSRFYMDFGRILGEINVNELSEIDFQNYQNIIDLLIKEKERINYDLSQCVIKIKKRDSKITKYDALFNKPETAENLAYRIELENNELDVIKDIVSIYKKRHDEREKNPAVFFGYSTDYNIGTTIFTSELYTSEIRKFILKEYIPVAEAIILSKNETIYEKIRHIKIMANLLTVEKEKAIKDNVISIIHKSDKVEYCENHGLDVRKLRNETDLKANIMMADCIVGDIKYEEVLNKYIEYVIKSPDNIEEILDCVSILNNFIDDKSDNVIEKLLILFTFSYEINDLDVRIDTIILSQVFIGTKYQEKILKVLEDRLENIVFEECKGYIQLIMNTTNENKQVYSTIIEKLKNNNNYYVKYMIDKYL